MIDAFIWLVVEAYKPHPVVPSDVVKEDTGAFLEDAGDDLSMVRGDARDVVPLSDVNQWAKDNGLSKAKLQDRLLKMGAFRDRGRGNARMFIKLRMVVE